MKTLFNLKPRSLVGIDISSSAIKLLEISRVGKRFQVESYAIESLPENAVTKKNIIENANIVGDAISRVVRRAQPRTRYAAIAVGSSVITKVITMPRSLSVNDMKVQIEAESAQYFNQNLDDIYIDFQVIGTNNKLPDHVDVLLAACSRETLEACTSALKLGGLTAKVVDIKKYALENALRLVAQNDLSISEYEIIALIDIGVTTTTMTVFCDHEIIYMHEEQFGQQVKLAQQISRMVHSYNVSSHESQVSHILIAGDCASIPDIIEQINNKVGGHVSIVNPIASMSIAPRVNKKALMKDAPALMVACGLALRTFDKSASIIPYYINLLPWRETLKKEGERRFLMIAGSLLAFIGLVVLSVHTYIASNIRYQQRRNDYLQYEIKKANEQLDVIKQHEDIKNSLIKQLNIIQKLEARRPQIVHLFEEIIQRVPDGVYFTSMIQEDDKIILEGAAQTEAHLLTLMEKLEQSKWITNVKIHAIEAKAKYSGNIKHGVSLFKLEIIVILGVTPLG